MCNTAALTARAPHLAALDALGRELLLVALGAVDVMLLGDEALGANGVLAGAADEALLVPLPGLVLHLLHPGLEDISAAVAPGGKLSIVARPAVNTVSLGAELFVHQAGPALAALETALVPVLLLVRKILQTSHQSPPSDVSPSTPPCCQYQ